LGDADAGARARALALRSELLGSLGREDEARRNLDEASSGAEPIDDETRFELELARLRYHVRRGDLDLACEIGRDLLANVPPSAERLARALVHRELGTVYRDLGPDHADRTERHLERAIEDFELMGCPHEVADTLRRYAQYFLLLGEDQLARDCEDRAGAAVSRAEGRAAIIELSRKERSA
ncbi:MAG TPA: hypothetical protein VK116_18180, partial [Planctomycetota bacterium]|nr:hypothetical protein [Planctomycetota bacterium]